MNLSANQHGPCKSFMAIHNGRAPTDHKRAKIHDSFMSWFMPTSNRSLQLGLGESCKSPGSCCWSWSWRLLPPRPKQPWKGPAPPCLPSTARNQGFNWNIAVVAQQKPQRASRLQHITVPHLVTHLYVAANSLMAEHSVMGVVGAAGTDHVGEHGKTTRPCPQAATTAPRPSSGAQVEAQMAGTCSGSGKSSSWLGSLPPAP